MANFQPVPILLRWGAIFEAVANQRPPLAICAALVVTFHKSSSVDLHELIGHRHVAHVNANIICLCVIVRRRVVRYNSINFVRVNGS